jgi:hypothetical protein
VSNGSPHTGSSAQAALRAAVKPFRRLELTLSNPLAPVELAFGLAQAVPSVLEPAFDALNVSPLTGFPANALEGVFGQQEGLLGGLAAAASLGATKGAVQARAGRAQGKQPTAEREAAERRRAVKKAALDAANITDKIAPGLGTTAAEITLGAAGAAQLLENLADTALGAFGSPAKKAAPAQGAAPKEKPLSGLLGGLAAAAAATQQGTAATNGKPAKKDARGAAAAGNPFEALAETLADLTLATEVNKVVPGGGRSAVAVKHGVAAGVALLEELADTALSVVAPAHPEHVASRAASPPARPSAIDTLLVPTPVPPAAGERGSEPGAAATPTLPDGRAARGGDQAHEPAPAAQQPQELAWLVNEALVEQARRHGVDLS